MRSCSGFPSHGSGRLLPWEKLLRPVKGLHNLLIYLLRKRKTSNWTQSSRSRPIRLPDDSGSCSLSHAKPFFYLSPWKMPRLRNCCDSVTVRVVIVFLVSPWGVEDVKGWKFSWSETKRINFSKQFFFLARDDEAQSRLIKRNSAYRKSHSRKTLSTHTTTKGYRQVGICNPHSVSQCGRWRAKSGHKFLNLSNTWSFEKAAAAVAMRKKPRREENFQFRRKPILGLSKLIHYCVMRRRLKKDSGEK